MGGFTITSTPRDAKPAPDSKESTQAPHLELAIQKSPSSPPAAWLWRPEGEILHQKLMVRVGGSFVWPPPGLSVDQISTVILIAGGVGIK
jgi:hypothetical protein